MRRLMTLILALSLTFLAGTAPARTTGARPVGEILKSYVEDFRSDPAAAAKTVFGISVKGAAEPDWSVVVTGRKDASGRLEVELRKGLPPEPAFVYTTDAATMDKIDRGEMNALTAMGKARESDPAPMDISFTPGFQPGEDFLAAFLSLSFHFWTRGLPEIVPFGPSASREVHGANMIVLYYQKGLRSAWGQIRKGQRVNADPRDQVNPFPSMFIGLRGRAVLKVGGVEKIMQQGQMFFIPPGTAHEAWNPYDEPAECIILMFGDGA